MEKLKIIMGPGEVGIAGQMCFNTDTFTLKEAF